MQHCYPLLRLLAAALVLSLGTGCIAVIHGGDHDSGLEAGRIGAGGSMSVTIDDHPAFEMHVSREELTLLVEGRVVVLPHHRGDDGVKFHDFDYHDREITLHLGRGIEATLEGLRLEVEDHSYELLQVGTYRIDLNGGYSFESN